MNACVDKKKRNNGSDTRALSHARTMEVALKLTENESLRGVQNEDGIWYFKTAIAFAKLCDLPYEYLTDMYNQLIAREDSVDKGNNLKGNSTSSIMSEANSILEP